MALLMSGLDFHNTPLDLRQKLAFSSQQQMDLLTQLGQQCRCILLSTCNRTELYTTTDTKTPWRLLCRAAQISETELEPYFITRAGSDAAHHLMEVACGLQSQILGDDQIITQIRTAMELAQQAGTSDAALSTLFRFAVTAGKRAKTEVPLHRHAPSIGTQCRDILRRELGDLAGKRILIIGNGQMGRLCADLLQEDGAQISMTYRTYRKPDPTVASGCTPVPYENRLSALEQADAVISVTASPHYTLDHTLLQAANRVPSLLVDLAVPRDIDPIWGEVATLYDMDSLGQTTAENKPELCKLQKIAEQELDQFLHWQKRQTSRPIRFPLFLDLTGKRVVIVGGGVIASRRIGVLRQFGCDITVISPQLSARPEGLTWLQRPYHTGDLDGAFLAVAATNDRGVNHQVGKEAHDRGIPVSVADCPEECSFYFPAICTENDFVAGLISTGKDHHKTARAAREIRRVLEELECE